MNFDSPELNLSFEPPNTETDEKPKSVKVHRGGKRQLARKAASEHALEESLDWHFKDGDCCHCFSFGDVGSLSYFKHVLKQQRVNYLALSTWCMAGEGVRDLRKWHKQGQLGRVDFFVGEIFRGSYPEAYAECQAFIKECGGRIVVF